MIRVLALCAALALGACAGPPKPVVDMRTVTDHQQYQRDLIECVTLADYYMTSEVQASKDVAIYGGLGAVGSAISASAFGPMSGSVSGDVGVGLAGGIIGGMITGNVEQEYARNGGTGRCLENRGYRVLNTRDLIIDPERWCNRVCMGTFTSECSDAQYASCVKAEHARLEARLKK